MPNLKQILNTNYAYLSINPMFTVMEGKSVHSQGIITVRKKGRDSDQEFTFFFAAF